MHFRRAAVIFVAACCSLAMGSMGGGDDKKFPNPRMNYRAAITDTKGAHFQAELVACGGETKLTAYQGEAKFLVPFQNIRHIAFTDHDNRYRSAKVTFWNGETHEVRVKRQLVCTGRTNLGEMYLKVRDLREVVFEKGATENRPTPNGTATPAPTPENPS
ncbi:hypothetical protein K8I61_14135 [bacterium]|nr:hypothetical protein [bacterium]